MFARIAAAVASITLASPIVASAGTYLGLGIGTSADGSVNGNETVEGAGRSGRLMIGQRIWRLSVEGQAGRYDMLFAQSRWKETQLGAGLKLDFPLGNNFELFGKGGVQRTWLNQMDVGTGTQDTAGNGWFGALGVEYRLNLGVTAASLFMDYQHSSTTFQMENAAQFDGSAGMWTLGATVSI